MGLLFALARDAVDLVPRELDGPRDLHARRLDDARQLSGHGLDTTGDLGDELLLRRQFRYRRDALEVVIRTLDVPPQDLVRFEQLRCLAEGVPRLDGAADVLLDEEPHVRSLEHVPDGLVIGSLDGATHQLVLHDPDGRALGALAAEFLNLGHLYSRRGHRDDHLGRVEEFFHAGDGLLLAVEGRGTPPTAAEEGGFGSRIVRDGAGEGGGGRGEAENE